jgi:hypothetical protein
MNSETRTHEEENSFGIVLPLVNLLLIFNICCLGVYGEERAGAVTEVGFSLQWLILRRLSITAAIYYSLCVLKRWE